MIYFIILWDWEGNGYLSLLFIYYFFLGLYLFILRIHFRLLLEVFDEIFFLRSNLLQSPNPNKSEHKFSLNNFKKSYE